ncbi:hypothetical protein AZE42_09174 [Rhizopogon vesiculosus]|uniref:Uncharacterized protein n=1 Tax=Rhizopogon vesiculosus TaxID=180088 RepID=A0A1J8QJZ9_9AGAM|nr:hypothetical protein AZE42_09174 [Rhizopogon vesiculosus]
MVNYIAEKKEQEPLTLSDIIHPSANANGSPPSRVCLDTDSSSKLFAQTTARASGVPGHYRHSSELSLAGFDSFTEARRGFEFHDNRPNFYPPPGGATSCAQHNKHESMFSIASVSSLWECPSLDKFSFSMSSIGDTFPSTDNIVEDAWIVMPQASTSVPQCTRRYIHTITLLFIAATSPPPLSLH